MALSIAELEEEREAAAEVKHQERILVILGNPPYKAFAGVTPRDERDLLEPYKVGVHTRNTLDDLYVRFYRIAERRIAEMTGQGIVSFISNSSFLSRPSFAAMRQHLLSSFDRIDVDNLNGDRDETGKRTPDGRPDPSLLSTRRNRAGIAEGTAITLMVRYPGSGEGVASTVRYRDFWGRTKREDLLAVLVGDELR
jgi:predicted helicase